MLIAILAAALIAQPPAQPAAKPASAAASPAPRFGPNSTFKDMLADARARAILQNRIPLIVQVIDQGIAQDNGTLEQVSQNDQARDQGGFTDEAYKAILADFAKL